jgi:RND family efflux transporter MFP subunit
MPRLLLGLSPALLVALPAWSEVPPPLTCLLGPARVSEIGTDLRGIVTDVAVERTDAVAAGDPLVRIDTALARARRRLAAIAAEGLRARLARSDDLRARNLVSVDELEQLATDLAAAEAELALVELEIARATIRAPFAGIVSELSVTEGELSGSEPLLTLIETDRLHAELVFLDTAFGDFAVGDPVRMAVDLIGAEVEGRVTGIDPFIDPASNSFAAVAEIDNADGTLPSGVSCRVLGESR